MFRVLAERARLAVREARFTRVSLLLAAGLNIMTWAFVLWFVLPRTEAEPVFALHYTVYFGVDRIGPVWRLGTFPLLGSGILLVNALVAARAYVGDRLASALFAGLTALFQALLFVSSYILILLNV